MNSKNKMNQHKNIQAYESRAPGLPFLTDPLRSAKPLGHASKNTVRIETRRQENRNAKTEINHYLEESVKMFNLLLNKKHNLVDTTFDEPKRRFVRDSSCRTFPFGGIEE